MRNAPLADDIVASFDGLPAEMRKAARFILDNPRDVALLSMREQARRADVGPATMMRLAKHLGYSGFDAVREAYAAALRETAAGFAEKAGEQARRQELEGDQALAASMFASLGQQIDSLASPDCLKSVATAADLLANARRVYCLGLRASHPVAWQLHYVLSLVGDRSIFLDAAGDTGRDCVRHAGRDDILFVVSVLPYTQATVEIAEFARGRGVPIVAITDSRVSPLAQHAAAAIVVSTVSLTFFHTMVPAFALAEALAVLVAGRGGTETLESLRQADAFLSHLDTYALPPRERSMP